MSDEEEIDWADFGDVAVPTTESSKTASKATPGTLVDEILADAMEAAQGIPADLMGNTERRSLRDIFMTASRLRGLGALFLAMGLAVAMINYYFLRA